MKIIKCWYEKWIKGYCRHLCLVCKYKDTCDYSCKYRKSKYLDGFEAGYRASEINIQKIKDLEYWRGYSSGYDDAVRNNIISSVYE